MSFFDKIKAGLKKTKENTAANINAVFATFRTVDEDLLSDLEDALILADIGAYVAADAIEELRKQSKLQNLQTKEAVIDCLAKILADKMAPNNGLQLNTKPSVILMVGVNGVGKTTSIGKIGAKLTAEGKKVLFAAADTFRAAAIDQLGIWAERAGVTMVKSVEAPTPHLLCLIQLHRQNLKVQTLLFAIPQADFITRKTLWMSLLKFTV